jgi:hypothetical protein
MMFPGLKPEQLNGEGAAGAHHLHHPHRHASRCAWHFAKRWTAASRP